MAAEPLGHWSPANSSARAAGGAPRQLMSRVEDSHVASKTIRHSGRLCGIWSSSMLLGAGAPKARAGPERLAARRRSCERRNAPATRRSCHQLVEGVAGPPANSHCTLWRGGLFPVLPPLDRRSGSGGNGVRRHGDGRARLRRRPVGRSRNRRCSSPSWGPSPPLPPRRNNTPLFLFTPSAFGSTSPPSSVDSLSECFASVDSPPAFSLCNYGSAAASPGFARRACFAVTGEGVATASCSRGSRMGSDGDFWIVRTGIYDDDRCGAFNSLSRRRPQDENSPRLVLNPFLAGLVESLLFGALSSPQHLLLAKNVQLAASVFTPSQVTTHLSDVEEC